MKVIARIDLTEIEIEIQKLEMEISDLQVTIDKKKSDLDLKKGIKKYIESHNIQEENTIPNIPSNAGITDFILAFLEKGKTDTRFIIDAYSKHVNEEYDDVANNVSNTLNRLRGAGKVGSEANEGGRKSGSKWFLIK